MTRHVIVESADHFLLGATGIVAGLVLEAITPGADVEGS
jgi:ammonia channel protein AmtB